MKLKKPVPVKLFGEEEVKVTELKTEGRMVIINGKGIKDTGYLFHELPLEDRKKVLNRAGLYFYEF